MNYKTLVTRGKKMLREENYGEKAWAWGDLALEVAPMGERGTNTGAFEALRAFAQDIGWLETRSFSTLKRYRQVASAWPTDKRVQSCSYMAHAILAGNPDRFTILKPNMKIDDVKDLLGHTSSDEDGDPGEKKEYSVSPERVVRALKDPETLAFVLSDPVISQLLREAITKKSPSSSRIKRLLAVAA